MNKEITYRYFEGKEDLELQYRFWNQITRDKIYCWKNTRSPSQFLEETSHGKEKTRCFAFVEDTLVGYCSFTGSGNFISMGYPWIDHREAERFGIDTKELRSELWNRVFSYAKQYGGTHFLQRFREQWHEQVNFFKSNGFDESSYQPLYMIDLPQELSNNSDSILEKLDTFSFEHFKSIMRQNEGYKEETIAYLEEYFDSISFDYIYTVRHKTKIVGYLGITHRRDTGFGEIVASAFVDAVQLSTILVPVLADLNTSGIKVLSITVNEGSPVIEQLTTIGFEKRSADVYLQYNLHQ